MTVISCYPDIQDLKRQILHLKHFNTACWSSWSTSIFPSNPKSRELNYPLNFMISEPIQRKQNRIMNYIFMTLSIWAMGELSFVFVCVKNLQKKYILRKIFQKLLADITWSAKLPNLLCLFSRHLLMDIVPPSPSPSFI